MSTNAGSKVLKVDSDVKGFGVAKYNPSHMANIMGFSHMADKYHVTYNSRKEDAFLIHTDQGIIKFVREGRLYTYEPPKKYLAAVKATNKKKNKRYDQFLTTNHTLQLNHSRIWTNQLKNKSNRKMEMTHQHEPIPMMKNSLAIMPAHK